MEKRLYSVKEISHYLNVPVSTVYTWAKRKRMPFIRLERLLKFDMEQVNEWLKAKTNCELIHQNGLE